MTTSDKTPKVPANDETPAPNDTTDAEVTPPETKPVDPKEEARRRSKEDLARKRRNLRGSRGKF